MPPVKRKVSTKPNPVQARLLLLAELVAPPAATPSLAYLERLANLKTGWLKDAGRHNSVSKTLAERLLDAAPTLRIEGLTTDWLIRGIGSVPHKGGENPPPVPQDQRSDGAPTWDDPASRRHSPVVQQAVDEWKALGRDMQHQNAVRVFKEALEAQDFAGSPVLRAMHGIAEKMAEMGYTQMSRHIWAEMGKYFGQQLPPEER